MPKEIDKNRGRIMKITKAKFQYSPAKLHLALNAISDGMAVATASRAFHVPRTTLRNKISGKSPKESRHCGFESHLGREIEEELVTWILTCAKMGFPIDKDGLLSSVAKLVREANIKTPFVNDRPGKKWYYSFLNRHKQISQKKAEYIHGGRGAVTEEKIRKWFGEVYASLEESGVKSVLQEPQRMFNMDETCFCLAPKSGRVLGPKGKHIYDERSASDKENVTTLFTVNAAGSFAPPLTIFKYDRIPASVARASPEGWGLGKSEKGWMTCECFFEYFSNVFSPFLKESKIELPVIVFLDGHKSHLTYHLSKFCRENQIVLVALVPIATHILKPLDVAVFGPLKTKWKNFLRKYRIENNGNEITKSSIPMALSGLMKDPKMASNIAAGFRATGLYPFSADAVDYSKIILRDNACQILKIDPAVASHLKYLETKIDLELLDEFKQTKRRNHGWEGKVEADCLYNIWLDISKDAENVENPLLDDNAAEELEPNNDQNESISSLDPIWRSSPIQDSGAHEDALPSTSSASVPSLKHTDKSSLSHDNCTEIASSPSASQLENIEHVRRNILHTVKSSSKSACLSIFQDVVPYPERKESDSKKKRNKVYLPSVITSNKWIEYHEENERIKKQKADEKQQKKMTREITKQKKEEERVRKQIRQRMKAKTKDSESSCSAEEISSSGDDVDYLDPGDNEETELFAPEDLKPGDFVIAKFTLSLKKRASIYKYLATILKVTAPEEYEIQCFKSLNEEKTSFRIIENDISIIGKGDIIGKLADPIIEEDGRRLKTVFPGPVDVFEKI